MRSVLFSVSAHSRVWLGHTTHPCCHRGVSGSPAHRTMLPNRPTLLRLPGERGRGRSFSAGDCGPQPHTGAGGQLLPGRAARAPPSDLFFRVARGAGLAGRVCARRAGGRRPKVSRADCAPAAAAAAGPQPGSGRPDRAGPAPSPRPPAGSLQYLLQLVLAGAGRDAQDVVQLRVGHVRHGGLPGSTRKQAAERKERDPDHERRRRRPRRRRGDAGGAEL